MKEQQNFKVRCLRALSQVPPGTVMSYSELAALAGNARAARAVGNLMSSNTFAPHLPCHRVIRSNGDIGSYLYGRSAKRRLLREEGVAVGDDDRVIVTKKRGLKQLRQAGHNTNTGF